MTYGKPVSTMEQRLEWLRQRSDLHQDVKLRPIEGWDYRWFVATNDHRRIAQAMKDAGLFAPSTYTKDIPIGRYLRKLRGLR